MKIDKIRVGYHIRNLRKEKGLILKDFESICSIGKMSNIENGITEVSESELELICERLGIPLKQFYKEFSKTAYYEKRDQLQKIEDALYLGSYTHAKGLLQAVKKDMDSHSPSEYLDSLIIISYLKGEYSFLTKQYKNSIYTLSSAINSPIKNEEDLKYQVKSLNLLANIYFQLGDVIAAEELVDKALLFKNRNGEIWKSFFNKALIEAFRGNNQESRIYLTKVNRETEIGKGRVLYLSLLLEVLDGKFNIEKQKISGMQTFIRDTHDKDTYLRIFLLQIYLHTHASEDYLNNVTLLLENQLELESNNNYILDIFMKILHSIIKIYLDEKDYIKAQTYVKKALNYAEKFPNSYIHIYTYYYYSKVIEHVEPNPEKQLTYLKKALTYQEKIETPTLIKGIIYYEIAKLSEFSSKQENSYSNLALDSFYQSTFKNEFNKLQIADLLPRLLY
ncbi:helix-turn-helix domain-containing protein [Peribacillus loiseleuriae]|uniref:helix-turn-helix domain-containing protein n=1 Tax=Peribacillus loiseleuriae TaxID=1679170 RepID=UPI003D0319C6